MGASLAGLLILAVMLSASIAIWRVTLAGDVGIQSATKAATQLAGEQARTIPNITAAAGNGNTNALSVTVKNDGATSVAVSSLPSMDVIVIYVSGAQAATDLLRLETFSLGSAAQ